MIAVVAGLLMFLCLDPICYHPIFPQLDIRDRMADGEDSTTTK
ncbi:MAG: hypothetical protein RIG63_02635 [Coleofasciculus chthonoplastes F3-SA18-01]